MSANETAPIFDEVLDGLAPSDNWNNLLNSAREFTHRPGQVLGYYAASALIEKSGFADFGNMQEAFISYAKPPMSREEAKDFRDAFGRMWALEDAFAMAGHQQPTEGVEV